MQKGRLGIAEDCGIPSLAPHSVPTYVTLVRRESEALLIIVRNYLLHTASFVCLFLCNCNLKNDKIPYFFELINTP